MAVPVVVLFVLPAIALLVDRVVGDGADIMLTDYMNEPYDLDKMYADSTVVSDDLLDEFGYGTDSLEEYAGYGEDSLYYYSDEFDEYYHTYGIYADEYGYDYFDKDSDSTDCKEDDKGKASTKEDACDLRLSGVDEHLSKDLPGGIDGIYKLDGCFEGLPKYKRTGKSANDTRLLWKSPVFSDWDISVGEEVHLATAVLYGIGTGLESRPNFLEDEHWRLRPSVAKGKPQEGDELLKVRVTVECDGKKQLKKPEPSKTISQPLLTDEETDANYRAVYSRYQKDAEPSINFFMVVLMLGLGVVVVVGTNRVMNRKQKDGRTLAHVIEDARKQRQGHTL